jgi:hypothetical protein
MQPIICRWIRFMGEAIHTKVMCFFNNAQRNTRGWMIQGDVMVCWMYCLSHSRCLCQFQASPLDVLLFSRSISETSTCHDIMMLHLHNSRPIHFKAQSRSVTDTLLEACIPGKRAVASFQIRRAHSLHTLVSGASNRLLQDVKDYFFCRYSLQRFL